MKLQVSAIVTAAVAALATGLITSPPATASGPGFGSVRGTFCGAVGTFMTFDGSAQVRNIVASDGKHSVGCYGVTPSHAVWWTPRTNPRWRVVSGNARANWTAGSHAGNLCMETAPRSANCFADIHPIIEVETSNGNIWESEYDPGHPDPWYSGWARRLR